MNTPIFTCDSRFTKKVAVALLILAPAFARAEWSVDFSRRSRAVREQDLSAAGQTQSSSRGPASAKPAVETAPGDESPPEKAKGLFDVIFDAGEPVQDIVILQTDRGFVPSTVRVRKNGRYRISVVNVNEKEKNVSFILDGFSEHHATYYGKIKTFLLEPKKEGAYSFQSPETSAEGKLVVFNPQISVRNPASESDGEKK